MLVSRMDETLKIRTLKGRVTHWHSACVKTAYFTLDANSNHPCLKIKKKGSRSRLFGRKTTLLIPHSSKYSYWHLSFWSLDQTDRTERPPSPTQVQIKPTTKNPADRQTHEAPSEVRWKEMICGLKVNISSHSSCNFQSPLHCNKQTNKQTNKPLPTRNLQLLIVPDVIWI